MLEASDLTTGQAILEQGLARQQTSAGVTYVASYGRDEFVAILAAGSLEETVFLAKSIRRALGAIISATGTASAVPDARR